MTGSSPFNLDFSKPLQSLGTSLSNNAMNTMGQRMGAQTQRQMNLNFDLAQNRLSDQLSNQFNNLPGQNTGGFFGNGTDLGFNLPTTQLAFGAAQSLSNMWNAYQANKMAKKQFDFTRDFANVNLENQTKQYNTTLSDISRTRGQIEGQSQAQQDAYYNSNKLDSKRI